MIKKRLSAVLTAALLAVTPVISGAKNTVTYFNAVQTSAADYQKNTEGFVTRMYKVVLNRNPDPTGLKNWTDKLNNHTATASDLIYGFFNSDEYKGRKKSNDQIITDCYNAMLDRNPDASGKNTWGSRLNIGMTPMSVCKGFAGSSEFKGLCAEYGISVGNIPIKYARDENYERTYFVYRLYKNCLGRTPDINGLENWCRNLKNGTTGSQIAQGFIFSSEYMGKYPSKDDFVKMLYSTILGRGADPTGLNSWTDQLYVGKSKQFVTNGFLFSNEFKGQCAKAGISIGNRLNTPEDMKNIVYPPGNYKEGISNGAYLSQKKLDECAVVISNVIANNITPNMTDVQKVRVIYDFLREKVPYSSDYSNDADRLYGAMINHAASCWGFASAFQYLCQAAGIECIFVVPVNSSNDVHRYNIVKVDGQYYCCDGQAGIFLDSEDYLFTEAMKSIYPRCPKAHPQSSHDGLIDSLF